MAIDRSKQSLAATLLDHSKTIHKNYAGLPGEGKEQRDHEHAAIREWAKTRQLPTAP